MKVLEIITIDQLRALRVAGFVIVHRAVLPSMLKAGQSTAEFHYDDIEKAYHRMIAESIRLQNLEKE